MTSDARRGRSECVGGGVLTPGYATNPRASGHHRDKTDVTSAPDSFNLASGYVLMVFAAARAWRGYYLAELTSPYAHLRQTKTVYLNPTLSP